MIYADTDFFIAILKPNDRLKTRAKEIYEKYKNQISTSITTFIELMLLSKRFNLDPIKIAIAVFTITHFENSIPLKAAKYIKDGVGVFDAFHAASCNGKIISSDHIFDKLSIKRIKLDEK